MLACIKCGGMVETDRTQGMCEKCGAEYIYREDTRKWEILEFKMPFFKEKRNRKIRDEFLHETKQKLNKFKGSITISSSGVKSIDEARKDNWFGHKEVPSTKNSIILMCVDGKFRRMRYEHGNGREKHMIQLLWIEIAEVKIKVGERFGIIFNQSLYGQYANLNVLRIQDYQEDLKKKNEFEYYIIID